MAEPPHLVAPESFDDCRDIADRFLGGEVVMIDIVGLEPETARRVIDFSSGTCYTGGGRLQRIREHLYLLVPPAQSSTHLGIRTDHLSDRAVRR